MTFTDYLKHYFHMPEFLIFLAVSAAVLALMHLLLKGIAVILAKSDKRSIPKSIRFGVQCEKFYELMFASTSMLFFIGVFFLVDYFKYPERYGFQKFWNKYDDILLLAALLVSIILTNLMDHVVVRLKLLTASEKGVLRIAAMMYMLAVFAYIKFIYDDSNYDSIIAYFIVMLIGRFIYFDASFRDFLSLMRGLLRTLPVLLLVLSTTGIMALYGFGTGYLLKSNGVVISLWIAHLFMTMLIMAVFYVSKALQQRENGGAPTRSASKAAAKTGQSAAAKSGAASRQSAAAKSGAIQAGAAKPAAAQTPAPIRAPRAAPQIRTPQTPQTQQIPQPPKSQPQPRLSQNQRDIN